MRRSLSTALLLTISSLAQAQPLDSAAIQQRLNTLLPRMQEAGVPGFGIAIVQRGQLVWIGGIGVCEKGKPALITGSTRFQTASISKSLAATVVVRLARAGRVQLDSNITPQLRSWQLPRPAKWVHLPVTPTLLLQHMAGINLGGSWGYSSMHSPMPTLLDFLNGRNGRSDDPTIRMVNPPGKRYEYSTGGYAVLEQWLVDIQGKPYPQLAAEEVFTPLGMHQSDFRLIPQDSADAVYATGHNRNGPLPGRMRAYPFAAGAGWNASAGDVARLLKGLLDAWHRRDTTWLRRTDVETLMTTPPDIPYGLGWHVEAVGTPNVALFHRGLNAGFFNIAKVYLEADYAVVILSNSERGAELWPELGTLLAELWPVR